MRTILTIAFLLITAFAGVTTTDVTAQGKEKIVYICTGPKAKVYHGTKDCKGLSKCSKGVKAVSETEAVKMGRRKCRMCLETEEIAPSFTNVSQFNF